MASPELFGVSQKDIRKLSAAKQRELRDLLQAARRISEENPLEAFIPYPKQRQFLASKDRTRAFYGGNRTGKSTTGCADDLIQALPEDLVPVHLREFKRFGFDEPFKGRVITPDLTRTMDVIVEKFRHMAPREGLRGQSWEKAFDKRQRILHFANESRIDFMSFEQEADKFGGVDLHRVHYDEEPNGSNSWRIYRDSRMRLIDHGGDEIFTMTPLHGMQWTYKLLWERRNDPGVTVIQAKMTDNIYLDPKEIEQAAAAFSVEERKAVIEGEPVHFEGLFFEEFGSQHIVKPPTPSEVQRYDSHVLGLDPSLVRTGVVWVAFDTDNAALVYDAWVPPSRALPQQIVGEIRTRNAAWGVEPDYNVIDPAARIGNVTNTENVEQVYERAGMTFIHGQNKRGPGIFEIKRRLQHGSLHISEDCRDLIWEFGHYRKDPKSNDAYAAIKESDDELDAMRYVLMSRPWAVAGRTIAEAEYDWTTNQAPPASWFDTTNNPHSPLGPLT